MSNIKIVSDEDYMDLSEKEDKTFTEEVTQERYEQAVLFNKNSKAVMQAINDQNTKLAEFQHKLIGLSTQIQMLNTELQNIKKTQMEELVSKIGNGPTV